MHCTVAMWRTSMPGHLLASRSSVNISRALLAGGRNPRLFCRRLLHKTRPQPTAALAEQPIPDASHVLEGFKKYFSYPATTNSPNPVKGDRVTLQGFLVSRRVVHSKLVFADVKVGGGSKLDKFQLVSNLRDAAAAGSSSAHEALRAIPMQSPVSFSGTVLEVHDNEGGPASAAKPSTDSGVPATADGARVDIALDSISVLNPFPKDIILSKDVQFPPTARHLQIRFSEALSQRLQFRSRLNLALRLALERSGFMEYETPILFKSTPEGAREFLVPTRRAGLAYALPQSPQQYKQILMASGVHKYFQFARCFRDEDLRADRQPEFTQLDLEMSFATGRDMMTAVEDVVGEASAFVDQSFCLKNVDGQMVPYHRDQIGSGETSEPVNIQARPPFKRISYEEAMTRYGIDKPDLRIPCEIRRIDQVLPESFIRMISDVEQPIVEAIKLRFDGPIDEARSFVVRLMDMLPLALKKNLDGAPAVLFFDRKKPLHGLSSLGHEGFAKLTSNEPGLEDFGDLQDGDVLIVQARKNEPFRGGSTALGTLRTLLYQEAVAKNLWPLDRTFNYLWVTDFPMFTPDDGEEPGQGGQAGFSATHHPFTAPLTEHDFELLATDPLGAKADHYDLVVNGVELGGGSRRIHVPEVQEYVMRDILKMTDAGVAQFSHLLDALRAGCPPHAGFALGYDRMVALYSGTNSVRDVIAFPKTMKGEDLMVKSPTRLTEGQLETYHLAMRSAKRG